jgi:hypothetical protein
MSILPARKRGRFSAFFVTGNCPQIVSRRGICADGFRPHTTFHPPLAPSFRAMSLDRIGPCEITNSFRLSATTSSAGAWLATRLFIHGRPSTLTPCPSVVQLVFVMPTPRYSHVPYALCPALHPPALYNRYSASGVCTAGPCPLRGVGWPSYVVRSLPTCDKCHSTAVSGVALSGLSLSGVSSRDRIDSPAAHSRVSDATGSLASASEAFYLPFRACCVFACNRLLRSCPALRGFIG